MVRSFLPAGLAQPLVTAIVGPWAAGLSMGVGAVSAVGALGFSIGVGCVSGIGVGVLHGHGVTHAHHSIVSYGVGERVRVPRRTQSLSHPNARVSD